MARLLARALGDGDPAVVEAATASLQRMIDVLFWRCADALGEIGNYGAIDALEAAAKSDPDGALGRHSRAAIANIQTAGVISPYYRRMKRAWVLVVMVGCGGGGAAASTTAIPATTSAPAAMHAAWAYSGDTGPVQWGDLDPGYGACKTGAAQSPIALPAAPAHRQAALARPRWEPVPLKITNTGHSVQVDDGAGSSLVVDGAEYKLAQFHFHSPAEHTVGGRSFDLEMHLVHKSADGKLAVVALLFGIGTDNAVLAPVWNAMPAQPGPAVTVAGTKVDVSALLQAAPKYLRYPGSLTAPPCTEGVTWLVVEPDAAAQVSAEQVRKLRAITQPTTNRPVQPIGPREVVELAP